MHHLEKESCLNVGTTSNISQLSIIPILVSKILDQTPLTQDVNWMHIRRSEDIQNVFWTSYVRSIYTLCLRGSNN